jgi:threonine dehydratase
MDLLPDIKNIQQALTRLKDVVLHTPLQKNINLSNRFRANVLLKREDLQVVRSYKIRGAYNKISSIPKEQLENGVVCASAGNHAQGVAYACNNLNIKGLIFMPGPTPRQKINQVKMFGKKNIEIRLVGDTFDDAERAARTACEENHSVFIHPFEDSKVIEGQGTIGLEILQDTTDQIDYLFLPVGGGGLAAGVGSVFRALSPETKIIGVEPAGAPAMKTSMEKGKNITLRRIDKFVDGAAVRRVGDMTLEICKQVLDDVIVVPEGAICSTILKLYNEDAIVLEPAGALATTALIYFARELKGKTVVSLLSGSNNDITRMEEMKERSMLYEGLKHYFIVRFPQRAGALKEFVNSILGPTDDITYFEYQKKTSRERGPAVIGIELQNPDDFNRLIIKMNQRHFVFEYLNEKPDLFQFLV